MVLLMRVMWDGVNLQISEGEEVEILRGIKAREIYDYNIRATLVRNVTRGGEFTSRINGVVMSPNPSDFEPPIHGYVKNLKVSGNVYFELEEKALPLVGGIIRECRKFIDPQLFERCKDKNYHDVVTNALTVLEERIREKINVGPNCTGIRLREHAFHCMSGKLTLGETQIERASFLLLFHGTLEFLSNPHAHRFTEEESSIEAFEIICIVDFLLRLVNKASLHDFQSESFGN